MDKWSTRSLGNIATEVILGVDLVPPNLQIRRCREQSRGDISKTVCTWDLAAKPVWNFESRYTLCPLTRTAPRVGHNGAYGSPWKKAPSMVLEETKTCRNVHPEDSYKVKATPCLSTTPLRRVGDVEIKLHVFYTPTLDRYEWLASRCSHLTPRRSSSQNRLNKKWVAPALVPCFPSLVGKPEVSILLGRTRRRWGKN